jgi:hypothetical protein
MKRKKYMSLFRETIIFHVIFKESSMKPLMSTVFVKGSLRMCCSFLQVYSGL